MKFRRTHPCCSGGNRARAGFTLAEVLAALLFMAIVIPVAIEGVRIASLAGQVAQRKVVAARLADNLVHELIATGDWARSYQSGRLREGTGDYDWEFQLQNWDVDDAADASSLPPATVRLVNVRVTFPVQGRDYEVRIATLLDTSTDTGTETTAP